MRNIKYKIMDIIKDMLKEGRKWSQGRIYLLWSVLAYYVTLGILLIAGLHKANDGGNDVDVAKFEIIIEALKYGFGQWTIMGSYEEYIKNLHEAADATYEIAEQARSKGLDPKITVEIPRAKDLADRTQKLLEFLPDLL